MAKVYDSINDDLKDFIGEQHVFFVATAPLEGAGHINLSPKGLDSFRILSPNRVAYLDLTASGNETSAHLHENGRITIMFCAFNGSARILRLYGNGRTILPTSAEWPELFAHFTERPGIRQIMLIDVTRVQTSCGFGIPLYEYVSARELLADWAETKGEDGLETYKREKNACSVDGLPTPLGISQRDEQPSA